MLRLKVKDSCALPEQKPALPRVHDDEQRGRPMSLNRSCKMVFLGRRPRCTAPKAVVAHKSAATNTRGNPRTDPVVAAALFTAAVVASMDCTGRRIPDSPSGALTTVVEKPGDDDRVVRRQQLPPLTCRKPSSILKNRSKVRPSLATVGRQISFGRNVEITIDWTPTPSAHLPAQETRHRPESHNRWRGLDLVRSDSMPRLPTRNLDGIDRPSLVRCHSVPSASKRNVKGPTGKSKRRLESV